MHGVPLVQAAPALTATGALIAIGFAILSAFLWWRFSLRQDELFNHVQNWALGMAAGWLVAALAIWAVLDRAEILPPMNVIYASLLASVLTLVFWSAAVRRWTAAE